LERSYAIRVCGYVGGEGVTRKGRKAGRQAGRREGVRREARER